MRLSLRRVAEAAAPTAASKAVAALATTRHAAAGAANDADYDSEED